MLDKISATGMAVSHDMGDSTNIHPIRKQAIGERLALLALNKDYGFSSLVPSGPLYRSVSFKDGRVRVFSKQIADPRYVRYA